MKQISGRDLKQGRGMQYVFGKMVVAVILTGFLPGTLAASADLVAEGRAIVAEHCTRCHVVPDINPKGGIESTPSFTAMKNLADWRRRFEVFYTLPPHPALVTIEDVSDERDKSRPVFVQEIKLQLDDIERILSYVDTIEN
jgi:hypothetical protein